MKRFNTMLGIGASTGGPQALQYVLAALHSDFPAPVLVAQHMPPGFTKSLAERLNQQTAIHVKEAEHGDIIKPATVYIAPGGYQMTIKSNGYNDSIQLSKEGTRRGQRPSVDVLFESMAALTHVCKMVVVLTGMGSDGAGGLSMLKTYDEQTLVIAESEQTAVVYGMPKAAQATSYVNYCVPIEDIGGLIHHLTTR